MEMGGVPVVPPAGKGNVFRKSGRRPNALTSQGDVREGDRERALMMSAPPGLARKGGHASKVKGLALSDRGSEAGCVTC